VGDADDRALEVVVGEEEAATDEEVTPGDQPLRRQVSLLGITPASRTRRVELP